MQNEQATDSLKLSVWTPDQLGVGAFDGGKITEIKPIPFPRESGGSNRIGPLFYWAWASANGDGVIGLHPHQGFEIISYVMEGTVGHTDTAGNNRRVSAGGIQAMQTGSGISHQEEMHGERTEFFQIWFEPNMQEALRERPRYLDFEDSQIPREELDSGVVAKPMDAFRASRLRKGSARASQSTSHFRVSLNRPCSQRVRSFAGIFSAPPTGPQIRRPDLAANIALGAQQRTQVTC